MHIHHLLALTGLMLSGHLALADSLDQDDVPNQCWNVCGPVVGISHKCDAMHDNDRAERKCVCEWEQAPTLVPLCEACIVHYRNGTRHDHDHDHDHDDDRDNDRDDDDDRDDDRDNDRDDDNDRDNDRRKRDNPHDNDANEILHACSFSTTSYNPTAATSVISAASTLAPSHSASATNSSGSGSGSGSSSGSGSDFSGSGSSSSDSASANNAETSTNAAPDASVPPAASMAAVVGLIGLVWL